jgi:hypothetical protein
MRSDNVRTPAPGSPMTARPRICIAPWYSVHAGGFVPRVYVLDGDGWPLQSMDGLTVHYSYEEAVEAARRLPIKVDGAAA